MSSSVSLNNLSHEISSLLTDRDKNLFLKKEESGRYTILNSKKEDINSIRQLFRRIPIHDGNLPIVLEKRQGGNLVIEVVKDSSSFLSMSIADLLSVFSDTMDSINENSTPEIPLNTILKTLIDKAYQQIDEKSIKQLEEGIRSRMLLLKDFEKRAPIYRTLLSFIPEKNSPLLERNDALKQLSGRLIWVTLTYSRLYGEHIEEGLHELEVMLLLKGYKEEADLCLFHRSQVS